MPRYLVLFSAIIVLGVSSCEKCKRCTYSYTKTTIQQTVNGEVEQTDTLTGILYDESGAAFTEECIKNDEEFTIEQVYATKDDTTVLDNFEYSCIDL